MEPDALLTELVKQLADVPDEVRIESHITEHMASHEIHVADSDVGKVLGKKARYAYALRDLFNAIYGKRGMRLHLQVIDPRSRK